MFAPTRGFSGMADSMEPCKMLCANPCCHGNDIWARRGDLVAYTSLLPLLLFATMWWWIAIIKIPYFITYLSGAYRPICLTGLFYNKCTAFIFTSGEEGGNVFTSVSLSVCLSVRRITEKVVNGFRLNFLEGRAWPRDQGDLFWWRSASPSWSRSPKSKIQIHWTIEKVPSRLRSQLHS